MTETATPVELRAIFPANLRILLDGAKSVAQSCREIGINRTQFNRYLSGESFPRPDVLQRICDYFGVDARVLLEPIDGANSAVEAIAAERKRQIDIEGWAREHDDNHSDGEMALVAALFASPLQLFAHSDDPGAPLNDPWPTSWEENLDLRNLRPRRELLVKAGALIAAEIERLDRIETQQAGTMKESGDG